MTNLDIANFLDEQALDNPFIEVKKATEHKITTDLAVAQSETKKLEVEKDRDLDKDMASGDSIKDDPTFHSDVENRFSLKLDYGHAQRSRR